MCDVHSCVVYSTVVATAINNCMCMCIQNKWMTTDTYACNYCMNVSCQQIEGCKL